MSDNCVALTATATNNELLQLAGQAPGHIGTNLSSLLRWDLSMTTALNILEYAMSTLEIS